MKILVIADTESKYYYDYFTPEKMDQFDMILACGDLSRSYLEFLVTMANKPLIYVRGNHDDSFNENPPEGCVCADGRVIVQNGIRILGLGGTLKYRPGLNMYTENQMRRRILRLWFSIWRHRGFDILLTHAPARGLGDLDDRPHRGFECFRKLLDRYHPAYMIHGHVHMNYGPFIKRISRYGDTEIINAWESTLLEFPSNEKNG